MKLINVLFLDYRTILKSDASPFLDLPSVYALKDVASKIDDIRIVAINTNDELKLFNYNSIINDLSQTLNLKKSLFFDAIETSSSENIASSISKWIENGHRCIRSFAIVALGQNASLGYAYPNNTIFCDFHGFSEAHAKNVVWIMSNYKNSISNCEKVWFTSDTHFGHKKIIQYCNRPWNHGKDSNGEIVVTDDDVLNMDNEMILRWNTVVGENDIVWHLGDFALGGKHVAERVFPQLNGRINLVMGNHDHWKINWYYDLGFNRVYDRKVIIHDFVVLTHSPLMFLNSNSPFFQIFGHVHNSEAYATWSKNSCCVCVERHNYCPVSWTTIKSTYEKMNNVEKEKIC